MLYQLKAMAYYMLALAEDEETQRRGVATVIYLVGKNLGGKLDQQVESKGMDSVHWVPLRVSVIHFCSDDPRTRVLKLFSLGVIDRYARTRLRAHDGACTCWMPCRE